MILSRWRGVRGSYDFVTCSVLRAEGRNGVVFSAPGTVAGFRTEEVKLQVTLAAKRKVGDPLTVCHLVMNLSEAREHFEDLRTAIDAATQWEADQSGANEFPDEPTGVHDRPTLSKL